MAWPRVHVQPSALCRPPANSNICRLWGNPDHLWYLKSSLKAEFPEDKLHVFLPKRNSGNFTYDGIEVGGERAVHEIEEEIQRLEESGTPVEKISVIGYSLGGLVARYAIGLLYHKGWFEKLEPVVSPAGFGVFFMTLTFNRILRLLPLRISESGHL
jgi:hypothetical protein